LSGQFGSKRAGLEAIAAAARIRPAPELRDEAIAHLALFDIQPDAGGPSTGGDYALSGGFWSLFAVQTPGAPLLSVARQSGNVRVFWPLPATGFLLDHSPTVTGTWSQISFPYTTNATEISITVPAPTGNKFYRLRKP
jgi:hypothetical protein